METVNNLDTGLSARTKINGNFTEINTKINAGFGQGQLLIGNSGGGTTKANLTAGANITITNGDGTITIASTGGGGSVTWGAITGTLSAQTDLQTALNGKQPLATVLTNTTASFTTAQETKLDGIATGATANATDAQLRDRSTHTGTQAATTITGLATVATSGSAADLTGNLAPARLNSGTSASNTTFWRGDGVWATPSVPAGSVDWGNILGILSNQTDLQTALNAKANLAGATFTGSISSPNLSGTNTGDQTITLTGDVTGSGTGSFATTVASNSITNAKLAQTATATFKGRTTAGTGNVEDLTATQATALLNVFSSTLKGLAPASGGGTTNFLRADGTWAAPAGGGSVTSVSGTGTVSGITLTGTVTNSGNLTLGGTLSATSANISDFNSATRAQTEATLVAGSNITLTPSGSGATRQITIAASGGGGDPAFTVTATGTGSSQNITLPRVVSVNDILVFVNGIYQHPTTDYTISGTTLTITATSGLPIMITFTGGATGPAGDGVLEGNKGEITVSGGSWTINEGVVGTAELATSAVSTIKIADGAVSTAKLGGDVTTAGKALLDDVDAAAQRATLGLGTLATASDGDKGDIVVTASGATWTIDATAVSTAKIADDAVTFAKMQNIPQDRLLGRFTAGSGNIEEVSLDGSLLLSGGSLIVNTNYVRNNSTSTDNAIARFDTTTGKLVQNSAATVSDDGIIRSATNTGANAVSVPLVNWLMQTADYTLLNQTAEQKAFNTTANGRLTLPTGVYYFDCWLYLTTMSATSGNFAFDPIGAGTAVTDRWGYNSYGIDSTTPLDAAAQTGSATVTQQTVASAVSAAIGAGAQVRLSGMFRISTGGTIIPSVSLVTAAAAVVKAGSWFKIEKVGESSETSVGAWS